MPQESERGSGCFRPRDSMSTVPQGSSGGTTCTNRCSSARSRTPSGRAALEAATRACPELQLHEKGLTLFLGPSYADATARVLMLGLNPGLLRDEPGGLIQSTYAHNYDLAPSTLLVGDPTDSEALRVRYWRNARRCFGATRILESVMRRATFSFCCPFRTPNWSTLNARQQHLLEECSRPVLRMMVSDCQPALVLVAGADASKMLLRCGAFFENRTSIESCRHKWRLFETRAEWGDVSVAELHHFSYFNGLAELRECGEWLTTLVARRGLTAVAAGGAETAAMAPRLNRKRWADEVRSVSGGGRTRRGRRSRTR